MGSLIPAELSLDCKFSSSWVPKTIVDFLAEVSSIQNESEKIRKLDDYVNRLQEEMKKIDAFKRVLPLSLLLLSDAIEKVKDELMHCNKSNAEPVFEEFMPLMKSVSDKKDVKVEGGKDKDSTNNKDKRNWLSSVQLWSSDNHVHHPNTDLSIDKPTTKQDDPKKGTSELITRPLIDDPFQNGKSWKQGRAFVPFKGCNNFQVVPMGMEDGDGITGLSLCPPEIKNSVDDLYSTCFSSKSSSRKSGSSASNDQLGFKGAHQQTARKQRRCWSKELHRRFVNALQQLGGAQAATPKQIRELMQVDDLTNDEVKSHLQKYRLHSRRAPPTTTTSPTESVVPGGRWLSREQCCESSKQSNSKSGSPQGPIHLAGDNSMEDDEDDEKSENHMEELQSLICAC